MYIAHVNSRNIYFGHRQYAIYHILRVMRLRNVYIAYVKLRNGYIAYLRPAIYILRVVRCAIYILLVHGTQFAVLDKRRSVLRMSTDSVRIMEM